MQHNHPFGRGVGPRAPVIAKRQIVSAFFPVAGNKTTTIPKPFKTKGAIMRRRVTGCDSISVIVCINYNRHNGRVASMLGRFPRLVSPGANRSLVRQAVLVTGASGVPITTHRTSVCANVAVTRCFHSVNCDMTVVTSSASH